jgi:hypothetical protein
MNRWLYLFLLAAPAAILSAFYLILAVGTFFTPA